MLAKITEVLGRHRLIFGNGIFRCSCTTQSYTKSRGAAQDAHDIHTAHQLAAAGLRMEPADPRQAFLERRGIQ